MARPSRFDEIRVEHAVDELPVLGDTVALYGLAHKSDFIQHAHRSRIPLEHRCFEAREPRILLEMLEHRAACCRHDAAAPKRLTQPVAELRRAHEDALARPRAYPGGGHAVYLDGKIDAPSGTVRDSKPLVGVGVGIRMWKYVGEVAPDAVIVGVRDKAGLVGRHPGPQHTLVQSRRQSHAAPVNARGAMMAESGPVRLGG